MILEFKIHEGDFSKEINCFILHNPKNIYFSDFKFCVILPYKYSVKLKN